jgi:hypothetical protein
VKNKIEEKYIIYNFVFKLSPILISYKDAQTSKELYCLSPPRLLKMPEVKYLVAVISRAVKGMK